MAFDENGYTNRVVLALRKKPNFHSTFTLTYWSPSPQISVSFELETASSPRVMPGGCSSLLQGILRCPLYFFYYQCPNPSIIVQLQDQGASLLFYLSLYLCLRTYNIISKHQLHRQVIFILQPHGTIVLYMQYIQLSCANISNACQIITICEFTVIWFDSADMSYRNCEQ